MTPRLKRIGLGLAAFLVVGLATLFGFVAFLHTGPGERWVSGKLEEALPGFELDAYHLRWPFRMRADYLRLVDAKGTWLEVSKPELQWHPFRLIRRDLHIDRLVAQRVEVRRLPEDSGPSQPVEIPDIRGTLRLDELSAPIVLDPPVLGERLELDLGGTFRMQRGGGEVEMHLRSAGGGLVRLSGTAGRDYLDLRWYLRVPQLKPWERLAGIPLAGDAVGSGFIAGRLPAPVVSGRVELGQGRADDFRWNALVLTGRFEPMQLALTVEAQAPRWGNGKALVPAADLSVVGDVAPRSGRIRLGHVRLEAGTMAVAGAGIVEQWGRDASLRVNANVPDLSVLDRRFKGGVRLRGQVAGNLVQMNLRGRVEGRASRFATGLAVLDRLLGPTPDLRAEFRYKNGAVALDDASLRGARARLWAAGPMGHMWAKLSVPDLSVFSPTLRGAGVAEGRVVGPMDDPAAHGIVHLAGLAVGGVPPGDGVLAFDLAHLATKPQGMLGADMEVGGYPLDGRARLAVDGGVRVDDLLLMSGQSQVSGNLVVAENGVRGRLKGSIPELKAWQRLIPLSGRVEADAVFEPQSVRVSARGTGISGAGVSVGTALAEGTLTGQTGTLAVHAQQVTRGAISFDRVTARGNGTARAFTFSVDGSGAGAQLNVDGSVQLNGAAGMARLDHVLLASGGHNASLAQPSQVRWGKDGVVLAPTIVTLGEGRLAVEGRLKGRAISARARLDDIPLDMADLVAPDLDAVGRVSGTASADGTLDDPRARVDVTGRNVAFAAAARAGLGRLAARLVADWRNGRVNVDATLRDGDRVQASASGSLPLPGDGPVSGRFSLSGDAGRISESLPLAGHVFAGQLQADGTVAGTMAAPLLSGRAGLTKGRYENLEEGTLITALSATAQLDGDRILVQAQGSDGGRGSVRADGVGSLDGAYGAEVAFTRFTALRRDDVEAEVNGTLRLEGDGAQGRVAGKLAVPRAEVDIARLKGSGPVTLDVVEINRPGAAPPKPAKPEAADIPVTVALAVTVAVEHAFVRGRGLDSEWQGDVAVAGTVSQPSLTGRLTAVRGEYDALGKQFRLTPDSEVVFQGGDTIDPSLNVAAEASATDITARIEVTGTANQPEIAITSQPPLPQDEVLARVLFGREAGKLSAFQQIQLAQMAASGLGGGGGGFDPVGKVRGLLGLDVLGIGSADAPAPTGKPAPGNAGPTLSAGKYIGSDTFVRVDQGTAGLGKVTVEQELGGGFSVESSVGEQSGGGIGFNWRKDY